MGLFHEVGSVAALVVLLMNMFSREPQRCRGCGMLSKTPICNECMFIAERDDVEPETSHDWLWDTGKPHLPF
jgi:hypothetical protein